MVIQEKDFNFCFQSDLVILLTCHKWFNQLIYWLDQLLTDVFPKPCLEYELDRDRISLGLNILHFFSLYESRLHHALVKHTKWIPQYTDAVNVLLDQRIIHFLLVVCWKPCSNFNFNFN